MLETATSEHNPLNQHSTGALRKEIEWSRKEEKRDCSSLWITLRNTFKT